MTAGRFDGTVRFQPGEIVLGFPVYRWQDVRSGDSLLDQIQGLQSEVERLKARLDECLGDAGQLRQDFSLDEVVGLGCRPIADLLSEFSLILEEVNKGRDTAGEEQQALWESVIRR